MASDHELQSLADGGHSSEPLAPDHPLFFLSDDFRASWCGDTEHGLLDSTSELVGATTTSLHPGFTIPEAASSSNISGYLAAEDPIGPSQSRLSSEYDPGFDFLDTSSLLPTAPASDAPYPPRATHYASSSSGYGPSQTASGGPPISASASGAGQANPSTGLRIFHSPRDEGRKTEWRAKTPQMYSIEITRHCLGPELWEKWNGRLYINRSTYDDADALYLRIDAQTSQSESEPETTAPSDMCERCQKAEDKPYPRKLRHKGGQKPSSSEMSHLSRIYCNWPLAPLRRTSDFFGGMISFFVFCHPSHNPDGKKPLLQPFRMIATLYKADASPLASYALAEEIISRTIAKNTSTIRSRSGCRNPRPVHAASTVPTTAHFTGDEGESGDNYPPEVPSGSVSRLNAPSDVGLPPITPVTTLPITPSITETYPAPLYFNLIVPQQGYSGQPIKFYGATFSPTVDYYAKFGELEPTPIIYRNPGLLEGDVPKRDKIGLVPVSIVTKEGNLLCYTKERFAYIGRDRENAEEAIKCASDEVDPGDALPDAKDATRRLSDSKKAHSASGPPVQEPSTQARRGGGATGDGAGAQDEMGIDTLIALEPTSELFDTPMQGLTYQDENGNLIPILFPPSRSWTDASAATTTTIVNTAASFKAIKAIKAISRKPTSKSIVSRWLRSNYGSENCRKRKRTPGIMEMEATDSQWGVGGSLIGSINLVLSPEQGKINEEDLPVVLMDDGDNDQQVARSPKRRRMEAPL